jgi:quercetin dioxygenase-like cupin family protein
MQVLRPNRRRVYPHLGVSSAAGSPFRFWSDDIMKITRNASNPSRTGATPENFTGNVRIDNMAMADAPSRVATAAVTFSPGGRTVWHTHPAGQTIVITAGQGWVQRVGGPVECVNPGDTVFFEAGEKHWHGATVNTGMTHIAVTEWVDGTNVEWLEPVSDEHYRGDATPATKG